MGTENSYAEGLKGHMNLCKVKMEVMEECQKRENRMKKEVLVL